MDIYQIGPDMPYDMFEDDGTTYSWVVVNYECYGYEGSGELVALRKDGKLDAGKISHCSCNCPLDNFPPRLAYTVQEFLSGPDNIHDDDYSDELKAKVRELLGL